ncbi:cytolysin [Dichomitus squalens LYAD-421 SS1]|uniref:Cytolysin n=1 Tax=Dichomitus squalens (strain LYAD-421) TaxID=732165 RepID=R7SQK5_DICSQ|nr:cytolysin [Dichomitus squalens LYAD-421 SS1]EJF58371.1 cytolysin [Dichomitus squalens LYAD-421 SS1]
MSTAKTSWEDLARLGWPINEVYKKANAWRGGTMHGIGDLSLNSGVAAEYQWWSYNTTIGEPYLLGRKPTSITREETAWSYDNTHNNSPFEQQWTESWTNSSSATLTVANATSINLSSHITIYNVASSGFDISVSTETSSSETKESSYSVSSTWNMDVGAGEKLTLIRVITTNSEVAEYAQDFGLENISRVGTKGDRYNGHYYWGLNLNSLLNNPRGRLNIQGSSRTVTYGFKLVREGPNGRTTTPLPVDLYEASASQVAQAPVGVLASWTKTIEEHVGTAPTEDMVPGTKEE